MRNNHPAYMKKSDFLIAVRNVYEGLPDEYLLALSNALIIVVARRNDPTEMKLEDYQGLVRYM